MKKYIIVVGVVLAGLLGNAQADHGWGVYGSYWDAGDWGSAGGAGAKLDYQILPHVLLDLRGTWYDTMKASQDDDVQISDIPLEGGLLFEGGHDALSAYAGGGVGYHMVSGRVYGSATKVDLQNQYQIGFYGVAGAEFTLTRNVDSIGAKRATLFVEAVYRSASVDDVETKSGETYRVGKDLAGPAVNVGLALRW